MLKSLKNKYYWLSTIIFYIIVIIIIVYMAYNPNEYFILDMNDINEKNVNFFYVLSSNTLLVFKNITLGLLTLGIYPLFSLVQNTLSLGIISNSLVINGYDALFFKMIPHGIFEILAIVISFTLVMYVVYMFIKALPNIIKGKVNPKDIIYDLLKFILAIIIIELILLSIAGVVETLTSLVKLM